MAVTSYALVLASIRFEWRLAFGLAIWSGPWFLLSALTVHTEQAAALATVAGIYFFMRADSLRPPYLAFFSASASVLIRLHNLFVFPAMAWVGLRKYSLRTLVGPAVLATIPLVLLWWIWGGLMPPLARITWGAGGLALGFQGEWLLRPLIVCAHIGFYSFPLGLALSEYRGWPSKSVWLPLLVGALALGLIFSLGIAGPLNSTLKTILHRPVSVPFVPISQLWWASRLIYALGLMTFVGLVILMGMKAESRQPQPLFCLLGVGFYAVSVIFAGALFVERYIFLVNILFQISVWSTLQDNFRRPWLLTIAYLPYAGMAGLHCLLKP
jgi:hypothetical protein